jgi:hypothetical protein
VFGLLLDGVGTQLGRLASLTTKPWLVLRGSCDTCRPDSSSSSVRFSGSRVNDETVQASDAIVKWLIVR